MRDKVRSFRERYKRYEPAIFFTAGFLFDVFTLRRIDDYLKLCFQVLFMVLLACFLILQYREEKGLMPPSFLKKIWRYQIEVVHFMFGSMLSAFVIFYFKSASLTRSAAFMLLLIILMFLNEVPRFREYGVRLRFALYGFCLASFLIYLLPVLAGFIATWLFLVSIVLSIIAFSGLVWLTTRGETEEVARLQRLRLLGPTMALYFILTGAYFLKVIPPVPLSMTFGGIYHKVVKNTDTGAIELYSLRPWYNFWSHGDKTFEARPGDQLYCFVRIFAPAKFDHKVNVAWYLYDKRLGRFILQDRVPIDIKGGREEGFRGYVYKKNYQSGDWRVDLETQDERVIGEIKFEVVPDTEPTAGAGGTDDRVWMIEEG